MTPERRCISSDDQYRVWFLRVFSHDLDGDAVQRCINYARHEVQGDGYRLTGDAPVVLLDELEVGQLVRFGFTEEPGDYEGRPST